jgi:hypothetical protein
MIKRTTWIAIVLLIILVGTTFLVKNLTAGKPQETATPAVPEAFLIKEPFGTLKSIEIIDSSMNTFLMQLNGNNEWIILKPHGGSVDLAMVSETETQLNALKVISVLNEPPDLKELGLDPASFNVSLYYDSGVKKKFLIGSLTPSNNGYYLQTEDGKISIVSTSGIDAILNLLSSPPYAATLTPNPDIEVTSTPTP